MRGKRGSSIAKMRAGDNVGVAFLGNGVGSVGQQKEQCPNGKGQKG